MFVVAAVVFVEPCRLSVRTAISMKGIRMFVGPMMSVTPRPIVIFCFDGCGTWLMFTSMLPNTPASVCLPEFKNRLEKVLDLASRGFAKCFDAPLVLPSENRG